MFGMTPTLTPQQVADREGYTLRMVQYLLKHNRILPSQKVNGRWMIVDPYMLVTVPQGRPRKGDKFAKKPTTAR
jgi:hypothetical protein